MYFKKWPRCFRVDEICICLRPWPIMLAGMIPGLHPANERWRYFVTTLIGWAQAQNQPWKVRIHVSSVQFCIDLLLFGFALYLTHWPLGDVAVI